MAPPAIIVVDDEVEIMKIVAEAFTRQGATVHTASGGAEALRLLGEHPIDAVVTDVRMPRMTGLELLVKIRTADFARPLVGLMSGYADMTLDEVYDLGAAALFSKPVSPRLLAEETLVSLAAIKGQWATSPVDAGSAGSSPVRIERRFKSVTQAKIDKFLSLGHGGFFFGFPEPPGGPEVLAPAPKRDGMIDFRIEFDEGPIKLLEGAGVTRWVRRSPKSESVRSGCGIELRALTAACREPVIGLLRDERSRAFIPRG